MKTNIKFFSIILSLLLAAVVGAFAGPVGLGISMVGGNKLLKENACYMPIGLQKAVWLTTLKDAYVRNPTWMNELTDMSSFVTDSQTLIFPEAGEDPVVYKNKMDDVDSVEPAETSYEPTLDWFDSQNFKIRQYSIHALPYDKIKFYTEKSAKAIRTAEALDAAWKFTPSAAGTKKIVIPTTGTTEGGFKLCTPADILTLAQTCDNADFPDTNRLLVLPPDMWWGLVKSSDVLTAQIKLQQAAGNLNPNLVEYYNFKIYKYNTKVGWNTTTAARAAKGAIITGAVTQCGTVIIGDETFRAEGVFNMTYLPFDQNPTGRAHVIGFQHRFLSDFQRASQKYSACIYQAIPSAG